MGDHAPRLICDGSGGAGFPFPALICLHVVIEIVLAFYGMSFKGPNSLLFHDTSHMHVSCGSSQVVL